MFHHNMFESANDRDLIDNNSCYKWDDISQKNLGTGSRYAERVDVFFAAPQHFASGQ